MDFDAIMSRIGEIAQSGVAKAKDLAEIGKLKVANAAAQDTIRKAYTEIGRIYFAQHGADPAPDFAALCAKIAEQKELIAYNDERISDIKLSAQVSDDDIEAMSIQIDPEDDFDVDPLD